MTDHITQHTYDNIAPEFLRVNAKMPPDLLAALERFVGLIGHDARVLDLGCGTGRDAVFMQSHGLRVIGADFSLGMLLQAKTLGAGNLMQMDMLNLGLPTGYFQGVWCNAALLHLPKQSVPDVLVEIHRVLVPQGALFVSVQAGTSEGYEPNPYAMPSLERFFARYPSAEIETLLRVSRFAPIESTVLDTANRQWVHVLSSAA